MTARAAAAGARRRPPLASFAVFELRRVLRTAGFLIWTLAFPVVFYLSSYDNPTSNAGNARSWGVPWPVYFMVSMCGWAAIAAAFNAGGGRLAAERASGWTRQLRLTPLPSWAYAAGKILVAVGLALAAAVVLALVAAGAARPDLSATAWAEMIAACWLGSLPFAALGILLGLVASSSSAQPVMIAAMLVLNVLGGLLVPLKAFPQWMRDVAYVLPTYRLGDLGWNAVAHRVFDPVDVLVLAGYGVLFATLAAWRYQADQTSPLG
jgi:ABC-2 type transport system permease protein